MLRAEIHERYKKVKTLEYNFQWNLSCFTSGIFTNFRFNDEASDRIALSNSS